MEATYFTLDLALHRQGPAYHLTVRHADPASHIADGGGGVAAVAAHLRHKDLQTASRYIDRHGASSRAINALQT